MTAIAFTVDRAGRKRRVPKPKVSALRVAWLVVDAFGVCSSSSTLRVARWDLRSANERWPDIQPRSIVRVEYNWPAILGQPKARGRVRGGAR